MFYLSKNTALCFDLNVHNIFGLFRLAVRICTLADLMTFFLTRSSGVCHVSLILDVLIADGIY